MAKEAIIDAIVDLSTKRTARRCEAKAWNARHNRKPGDICVRSLNMLRQCAQITVAIIALKEVMA